MASACLSCTLFHHAKVSYSEFNDKEEWDKLSADAKKAVTEVVHKKVHSNIIKAAGVLQKQRAKSAPWPTLEPLTFVYIKDDYGEYTKRGIIAVTYSNHRCGSCPTFCCRSNNMLAATMCSSLTRATPCKSTQQRRTISVGKTSRRAQVLFEKKNLFRATKLH